MALSKLPYKGTRDFFPADMRRRNYIFQKLSEVSERFAYEPYDGPMLEELDLYKAKSGEELINEQVYNFVDRGEREVAIRPEMTPTVARMVAQIHREVAKPLRWYAIPNLMRYEKPQRGRLREFWQYNADVFGGDEAGDLEITQLAVNLLRAFGANHTHFEILVNDRRFVDFVFKQKIDLPAQQTHKLYKLLDRKNKMDPAKFSAEVNSITNDASKTKIFEDYLNLKDIASISTFAGGSDEVKPLINYLTAMQTIGLGEYVKFDPSIVRGLDYYTGVVFEIFDKHPDNRRAIAGGGAYANLLQIFDEPALAGMGFGMGEVTLTDFLVTHKLIPDFSKQDVDVLVAYMDKNAEATCFGLASGLRERGLKAELYLGEAKPKKVFGHADKKGQHFLLLIGGNELASGEAELKNLKTRDVHKVKLADVDGMTKLMKGN